MNVPFKTDLYLRPKVPQVGHIPRSYAILIRDDVMARVKAMPFFAAVKRFSTSKAYIIQTKDIPYCAVYFIEEMLTPDGDPNIGEPRFRCSVQIGFSVYIVNNDPEKAEHKLDDCYQAIINGLLKSPTIFSVGDRQVAVQAFSRGRRVHAFGNVGLNNETPVAELQFILVFDLGTVIWEPIVLDPLEVIHVSTEHSGTDENSTKVISEYDMEQNQ